MCGICGQFNYASNRMVAEEQVRRMAESMIHRGPDDEGFFFDGALGLGFRRLSIIDLAGGHQPMSDQEESVWVVFNGEIYNYLELRAELEALGHRFQSRSDTEVIVHGYKEWGVEVLNRFNGMFGLCIWDVRKRRLVLARDAMGIKPVYFRDADGELTFGSEIRAVLAGGQIRPEVDPASLNLFLRFRYVPSPRTMFQGIQKLAPGTMLVVEDGACREQSWYAYTPVPFDQPLTDEEAIEELLGLYRAAVKRHLLSDVPVGILLSGGLDSGLLLSLMKQHGSDWPAYTIGYGETFEDDELVDAAESARMLGARFIPVRLNRAEYEKSFASIVDSLEEPVTSSSVVPMYFVCQWARQDVKVALIGQGPDELFAGYTRHLGVQYGKAWRTTPAPVRSLVTTAVQALPRHEALKRGVQALAATPRLERYHQVFSLAPASSIRALFREDALPNSGNHGTVEYWRDLESQMQHLDELSGFQLLEIRSSLPDELLMFGDKLSMAHSLEVRVPYLDRTIVEFAQRLGASFMIRRGQRKWIHRHVCRRYLPAAILRRKKRGFAVNVVDGWFHSTVDGTLGDLLLDHQSMMYALLKPEPVRRMLADHRAGRADNHKLLFSLAMLEQWLRGVQTA